MTQIFVRLCKGIVCNVLTVLMLTVCSLGSAFAQQWETVKMYDFSDPAFDSNLGGVAGFYAAYCSHGHFGASGAFEDRCAFTSFASNTYIAMEQSLEAGTNYRLSVNAKTTNSSGLLSFSYASWGASGTVIDNDVVVDSAGLTDPGNDYVSSTFTVDTDGVYWVFVKCPFTPNMFLDNFTLERESGAAPVPAFNLSAQGSADTVSALKIAPGDSTEICLVPDEPLVSPATVDISINGDGMPHFPAYTQSLDFPAGEPEQRCFTLSPTADTTSKDYNFEMVLSGNLTTGAAGNYRSLNTRVVGAFTVSIVNCQSVAGPDRTICAGESVQLGTGCLPAPHPVDGVEYCYAWEPVDGLDDPTAVMPFASPTETTTYTVYVTSSEGELITEEEVTVTVNKPSDLTVTPTEPTVCEGGSVWLEAVTWLSADVNTYKWSTGETTAAIEVDAPGTYAVTITDVASGCMDTGSIEVAPATFSASVSASSTTVCPGVPSLLSVSVTPEGNMGDYTYYWSNGLQGSEISEDRSGLYDVTVSNQTTGCETVEQVELQAMDAAVSIFPEAPVICPGGTLELSVEDQYTNYTWSTGATENAITVSESEVAANPEFSVTVTAANGCEATASVEVGDAMDTDDIQAYFQGKGFFAMDIEIDPDVTLTSSEPTQQRSLDLCSATICSDPEQKVCVRDDAQKVIAVEGEVIDNLADLVKSYMDYFKSKYGYDKIRTFITKNDDLCSCSEYLDLIEGKFEGDAPLAFWIHLFEAEGDGQDKFYILTNVPSSDAHYPGGANGGHANLSSALAQANVDGWTGNTVNEAAQAVFASMDNSLDNFMDQGLSAAQGGGSLDQILCDGASTEGMVAISPAGIPMNVPDGFITRFVPNDDMIGADIPEGALLGLTDFTDYEQSGEITYYRGRVDVDGQLSSDSPPMFVGYHRMNTVVTTSNNPQEAFYSVSPFEVGQTLTVTLGELSPPWPESTETVSYSYANYVGAEPDYINNGSGVVITDFFSAPALLSGGIAGPPAPGVPVSTSPVTAAEFLEAFELLSINQRVASFRVTREDGTLDYVVFTCVGGQIKSFMFNCYTGVYEEIDLALNDAVAQSILQDIQLVLDVSECIDEEESALDEQNCFVLDEEIALAPSYVTPPTTVPSSTASLQDFAGLDPDTKKIFQQAITQASQVYGANFGFIITADNSYCTDGGCGYDNSIARSRFQTLALSTAQPHLKDAVFKIHFTEDDRAFFCVRLAEDFYQHTDVGYNLPEEQALLLKNMYIRKIRDIIRNVRTPQTLAENANPGEEDNTPTSRPNFFGLRPHLEPTKETINPYTITSEVTSIGVDFMRTQQITDKLWRANLPEGNQPLYEVPEPLVGIGNVIVSENPLVGAVQLGNFGWSFVNDKQLRGNIVEMVRQPLKTARAFYQDKRDTYAGNGPNGIEGTYYAAGEDGASLVMFLVGGNIGAIIKVADKVSALPRRAEPAVREWNEDLDGIKHHSAVDLDGISSDAFYKYFQDGNFTDAEIEDYLKFAGDFDNPIDQKKLKSQPSLAVLWKKNKDGDPDFCSLSLTSGTTPVEIRSSGCDGIDLKSMIKKLPPAEDAVFWSKYEEVFIQDHFDADGILDINATEKVDEFLLDLQKEGDDFLAKFVDAPYLMDAWNVIPPILRKNIANLESVDAFVDISPGSLASIKDEFANLASDRHQSFINGLGNVSNNDILSASLTLNRIPNVSEISAATNKIKQYRIDNDIPSSKNFGYLDGSLNGGAIQSIDDDIISSGPPVPVGQRIFDAIDVGGWERYTDSEYKMLNQLATDLGAQPGVPYINSNVTGNMKIISERPYCASCQGVVQQFNEMFPNIEITLIDGVR